MAPKTRRFQTSLTAMLFLGALLITSCGSAASTDGGDQSTAVLMKAGASTQTTTASQDPAPADPSTMWVRLALAGAEPRNFAVAAECTDAAASKAEISETAQALLLALNTDDWGAAALELVDTGQQADAEIFIGSTLRLAFDACVDADVASYARGSVAQFYPAPAVREVAAAASQKPANLVPAFPLKATEKITSSQALQPGLVSMLGSFAVDDAQRTLYANAGSCLASTVLNAGFSQAALRFLYEGAPLGSGSVAEHLAIEDQGLWNGPEFQVKLSDCLASAAVKVPTAPAS